ncbi:MAG: YlxR family protein [Leucobacter sp.]|nr:YlxR family protein [Leucobacter sp.]
MISLRTCVGCRERAARDVLVRVVLHDGQLQGDERAALLRRGARVHSTAECLKHAVSRRSFARALNVSGVLDTSPLENRLETTMDN